MMLANENHAVAGIVSELGKPENRDLLVAIMYHGLNDDKSFMWDFRRTGALTFDQFAFLAPQMDAVVNALNEATGRPTSEDLRSMSERFDEYLEWHERDNDGKPIDQSQTERFDAICAPFDDGWSGAYYGCLMRRVQYVLVKMAGN